MTYDVTALHLHIIPLKGHAGTTVVMTVAARFTTDDYGALFETCLNRYHVVFSSIPERSNDVMEFSMLTKRNTIPHFHPASRLKPSGRMFLHGDGKT